MSRNRTHPSRRRSTYSPSEYDRRRDDGRGGGRGGGLPLWPLVFVLVAVVAIGCFALWKGVGETKEPEEERQATEVAPEPDETSMRVARIIEGLTLEQKVAQLFVVRPESITGVERAIAAGDATRDALLSYPVGGICYFAANLESPKQTTEMLRSTQNYVKDSCGLPLFMCVDEEGGTVTRVACNEAFGVTDVGNMRDVGDTGKVDEAFDAARVTGTYLCDLGFNVDFAPVADIVSSESSPMYLRSFGTDAGQVAEMVAAQVEGFSRAGILCAAKHFPGIGASEDDSHNGRIYSSRTVSQMKKWEFLPFEAAIDVGVPMIMVGHLSCLGIDSSRGNLPASLNPDVIEGLLRGELGYEGIVVTDSLEMGAVTDVCDADEQGVLAIKAGADLILLPEDFHEAYRGLIGAVRSGKIPESRIDESLSRIIRAKLDLA